MNHSTIRIAEILCPTDFSVFSSRALRHAIVLARRFHARVTVAHVLPLLPDVGAPLASRGLPSPELRAGAERELREFLDAADTSGVELRTRLLDGDPWREILALARELPADLAVLGTHGTSGFERLVLGSVTSRLLGRLPCPVITVSHEEGRTWESPGLVQRILCATDFSPAAVRAGALAVDLAQNLGAQLTLMHVIEALPDLDRPGHTPLPEQAAYRKALEEDARTRLGAALPDSVVSGAKVDRRVAVGRAAAAILEASVATQADLIVLGTHGGGMLDRLLFGSTSERVVRGASCPVLSVSSQGPLRMLASETDAVA
jgi:nucleotide-binding universal stress UspA family protein